MAELKGTFYGVSVGPGDPELMTLQAVRLIRQCPVLAAPQTASGQMLALDIARSALGEALDGKTIVPLYFAMSRDPACAGGFARKSRRRGAAVSGCRAGRCHAEPWGRFHLCHLWLPAGDLAGRGLCHRHGGRRAQLFVRRRRG